MRRMILAAAVVATGCLHHGVPKDLAVETTFPAAAPAALPGQLRVVTFNVHGVAGRAIAKALRADRALRTADVIILEEVHRHEPVDDPCSGACALAKELGYHAVYAPGHDTGHGSDGVAIVSRVPIASTEVIELPFYNVHVNTGRRIALAATLDVAGSPVTVYAVHLENRITVRQRRAQMKPVLEHAARRHTPVIIAGDFNTSPFTWLAHLVPIPTTTQPARLEETVRSYGFATPVSDSGPTSRFIGMRLDAIYTRGFDTLRFATSNASNISDHIALWADLRVARPTTAVGALAAVSAP